MDISALLTSAGINIGIFSVLLSLYSILRKQPSNRNVYFGRKLAKLRSKNTDPHWFDRFVPSPSWILKAWEISDEVILAVGGLDAVVFVRTLVFSIRIFSIATIVCIAFVLPLNYYGQEMDHKFVSSSSLVVFTTQNVKAGSKWLWAHCLALYIITFSACTLLYFENRSIIRRRLTYIKGSGQDLSQFAVLVRGIPRSEKDSYSTTLKNYFMTYYPSSYLSHQMVYHSGNIEKLMRSVREMYDELYHDTIPSCRSCGFSGGGHPTVFNILVDDPDIIEKSKAEFQDLHDSGKECPSAFVFFKTRYEAACAAQGLQSSNPMTWVIDQAPEPLDVYWPNLSIPYRQFWLRRTGTFSATTAFLIFFAAPVTLVQSLANARQLQQAFPFLRWLLKKEYVSNLITGYLPSVVMVLVSYTVPPLMILFSTIEGSISRSGRKRGACCKVLFFIIWNVFFFNIASGTVLNMWNVFKQPKDIPLQLAELAVPAAVNFFMTYVLTSGWTSLACEVVQLYPLLCNFIYKVILRKDHGPCDGQYTFPYQTEFPRVLLFGLLGLNFAILAPLILPLLLVYFCLAYLVYRNQILNVYVTEYDSGGKYWPIVHTSTIFSLVLAHVIAMGVFISKKSPVCFGFTIPLVICTLLFNEYSRRRFLPVFRKIAAEVLIDLDQQDEQSGQMASIHQRLQNAYNQFEWLSYGRSRMKSRFLSDDEDANCHTQELKLEIECSQEIRPDESTISVHEPLPQDHDAEIEPSPLIKSPLNQDTQTDQSPVNKSET